VPSIVRRLVKCERAATTLEYMLIAALVALAALQISSLEFAPPPVT
jgi:Flp pilus assembly pilin Flp